MLRKISASLAMGVACFFALQAIHYYPAWWVSGFALAMLVLAFFQIHTAIILTVLAFSITVASQSGALFIMFVFFTMVMVAVSGFKDSPEAFMAAMAAPVLAVLNFGGIDLPLEFSVVFLLPVLLYGNRIPVVAALSCLWCAVTGIVGRMPFIGNLVVGTQFLPLFYPKRAGKNFYDIGWFFSRMTDTRLQSDFFSILGKIGNYLVGHPVILIQVLGWAIASFSLNYFIDARINKNKRRFLAFGVLAVTAILILFQLIALIFYPKTLEFSLFRYLASLAATGTAFFGFWEWNYHLENKDLPKRITPTAADVQNILQREEVRRKELSLEETIKMQAELQTYIQKKFVREVTALDIDIAESTKLKEGQPPEAILHSFNAYWKMVDLSALGNGGRLLNRAGDGAIYLFGKPDEAIEAAKEILKELRKFNEKTNTLKSPFLVRMGLNTGEIIEDPNRRTGDVFSQVLDISGHLQKMAGTGEILVSENTYKLLAKKGDFAARGISEKDNIPIYGFKGKV